MTRATYSTPSDRASAPPEAEHAEPTLKEADEALIALARRTQQAHKAARIEAIVREPDL